MTVSNLFHPAVAAWFDRAFAAPTAAQAQAWPAIQSGRDVLIAAPTGSGKTLAAFLNALDDLFVEEVLPAPDCGRLLVHVVIPAGLSVVAAMAALGREAPGLRSEVASAISRKRAPELCFVPVYQDGGCDE